MKTDQSSFDNYLTKKLQDPVFKKEWGLLEAEYIVMEALIDLRKQKCLSQRDLAKLMNATQPEVARIEKGHNVTINTLQKIAKAVNKRLIIKFV